MTERTIDLRSQKNQLPRYDTKESIPNAKPSGGAKKHLLEWAALEYPVRERGPYWFLPPAIIALAFVLFGIFIHSWLFVAFVTLALFVILLYAKRPPREYRFRIARDGIYIGETLHRFSELKSFWIIEAVEPPELSLETAQHLRRYLHLPLGDMHPNKIRAVLADFLPEEKHEETVTDQIARSIEF